MQPSSPKSIAGTTLVELVIMIAIVAVLGLFTINGIVAAVHKARAGLAGINLVDSLTQARSLALTRESDVVICPSSDGRNCLKSDHWETGWIAFSDIHEDGERRGSEPVLIAQGALGAKVHLVSSEGRTRLRFQRTGSNGGSNVTFTLCDGRGPRAAVSWILSNRGNLRSAPASAAAASSACYGG
jgi:type IV fimbrial biogenesis protein FimT